MRLRVLHTTRYLYPAPASDSYNEARLMPLSDADQTCLDFRLTTTPPARIFAYDLPSGRVHHFKISERHNELTLRAEALVVTRHTNPFTKLQLVTDDMNFYARPDVRQRYYEYLQPTRRVPLEPETERIAAVARRQAGVGTASFLIALTRLMHKAFRYAPGTTTVNTPLQHVLENKQGVCQDFAHLMLSVCRRQGIPARYISGYLYTGEPKTLGANGARENSAERRDEERAHTPAFSGHVSSMPSTALLEENEAGGQQENEDDMGQNGELVGGGAMHAWVECLMPDGHWRGFDPTNNMVTNDYYIKVHHGRDYGDALPIRGLYRGPLATSLDVAVTIQRETDRE